jgi:hypothetical protein
LQVTIILAGQFAKPNLIYGQSAISNSKIVSPFQNYDNSFYDSISNSWYALLDGQKITKHKTGKVVLQFHLNYDGQITNMKVLQNSAGYALALICRKAVLASAPYKHWPDDMIRMVGANYRIINYTFYYY